MMHLGLTATHQMRWPWKCRSGTYFIKSNISAIIKLIWIKNDDADTEIVTFMCSCPHFFIPDNWLPTLHGNTPQTCQLFAVHRSSFSCFRNNHMRLLEPVLHWVFIFLYLHNVCVCTSPVATCQLYENLLFQLTRYK